MPTRERVFDWDRAAGLIREHRPTVARAGLRMHWDTTGGTIYQDGKPVIDDYTYLSSCWFVPEIDLGIAGVFDCWRYEDETPGWGDDTKWPESALEILRGHEKTNKRI